MCGEKGEEGEPCISENEDDAVCGQRSIPTIRVVGKRMEHGAHTPIISVHALEQGQMAVSRPKERRAAVLLLEVAPFPGPSP